VADSLQHCGYSPGLIPFGMRYPFLLTLCLLASACGHRKAYTSDRIFDACLKEGKSEYQCKRSVGCSERLSKAECRKAFKKRHKFYIDYN